MEIYIEYAFLENFIFDGTLLWLSLKAMKLPVRKFRLCLSASLGGIFALLFPLLRLPYFLSVILKLSFGFFLCLLLFSRLKTKKEWGRYALTSFFFFAFSFGFGGSLLGVYGISVRQNTNSVHSFSISRMPSHAVFLGFFLLILLVLYGIRAVYARKQILQKIYSCRIVARGREVGTHGFLDSGNLASKNGIPVCFTTIEVVYELWGEDILNGELDGQVCDEMEIVTLTGIAKLPVYLAELEINTGLGVVRKTVYFAPSKNMIAREYKILLHAGIFENQTGEDV